MHVLLLVVGCLLTISEAWTPGFFHGRPREGLLSPLENDESMLRISKKLPSRWFNQTLNHFDNADGRVFQQRYFMNNTNYKIGGPVFLFISGETKANTMWLRVGAMAEYAKEHKAWMFMLEHRYYGDTHPTVDSSFDNLQYLSSEQALADIAQFITYVQVKYTLPENKWIVFGGSYAGALAAWVRMKYPHLITGAVSSSGPVLTKLNFFEYLEVVQDSLALIGKQSCVDYIQQAVKELDKKLTTTDGVQSVKTMFNLCDDFNFTVAQHVGFFYMQFIHLFEIAVQYNMVPSIENLCGVMNSNTHGTPLNRLALITTYFHNRTSCIPNYDTTIEDFKKAEWNFDYRQWFYQTCTELGFFQTSDSNKQPFGHHTSLDYFTKFCQDVFDPELTSDFISRGIKRTNTNYGGRGIKITNVVFTNGGLDPWHALGILKNLSPDATSIFIPGQAHCSDLQPSKPTDPPALVNARASITQLIGQWLHSSNTNSSNFTHGDKSKWIILLLVSVGFLMKSFLE